MAHRKIYKPCEHCGTEFTLKGSQSIEAQQRARFCSSNCYHASRWRELVCEHCTRTFQVKASIASVRKYCSRACMFDARRCAGCGRLASVERQERGRHTCSDRCDLILILEQEQRFSGVHSAPCNSCKKILPAEAFARDKTNRNGLSAKCKDCARSYYQQRKDDYRLRRYTYDAAPGGIVVPFTSEQKAARFALWGGRCWMCGVADSTSEDHVKPISKGGSHCLANLRPICLSCNASKGGRWPLPQEELLPQFKHASPRPGSAQDEITPRMPRVDWQCAHCQKTENIRACEARTKKYCSRECALNARGARTLQLVCRNPLCAKTFEVPDQAGRNQRKFCTIECAWVARDRPAHWGPAKDPQPTLF